MVKAINVKMCLQLISKKNQSTLPLTCIYFFFSRLVRKKNIRYSVHVQLTTRLIIP